MTSLAMEVKWEEVFEALPDENTKEGDKKRR